MGGIYVYAGGFRPVIVVPQHEETAIDTELQVIGGVFWPPLDSVAATVLLSGHAVDAFATASAGGCSGADPRALWAPPGHPRLGAASQVSSTNYTDGAEADLTGRRLL